MIELKPCPFCGGEAKLISYHASMWIDNPTDSFVKCKDCGATTIHYFPTEEKAIEAWNRRAEHES